MKRFIVALSVVLFSGMANAEFIHNDWKTAGDSRVLLDYDTGIEWLKLDNTDETPNDEVIAGLASGGAYEGWRLPTVAEVQGLILATLAEYAPAGSAIEQNIETENYYKDTKSNSEWGQAWREMMGLTFNAPGDRLMSYGVALDESGDYSLFGLIWNENTGNERVYLNWKTFSDYENNPNFGLFLVSDGGMTLSSVNDPMLNINNPNAPVNNVPGTLWGAGLIALAFITRRRVALK